MPAAKVELNGATLAESKETVVVDGNHYFPRSSIQERYFEATDNKTCCPWKGDASYYSLKDDSGEVVFRNAAWYYPTPKDAAISIKDHIAFYSSKVQITEL